MMFYTETQDMHHAYCNVCDDKREKHEDLNTMLFQNNHEQREYKVEPNDNGHEP